MYSFINYVFTIAPTCYRCTNIKEYIQRYKLKEMKKNEIKYKNEF